MGGGEKDGQGRDAVDDTKLLQAGILSALGVALSFVFTVTNDGLPKSPGSIVFADVIFIVFLIALILAVNHYIETRGRRPTLSGARAIALVAVVTSAVVAGVLAGRADLAEEAPSTGGSGVYAKQLRVEIQRLRRAGGLAYSDGSTTRKAYSQEAQDLGELYGEVSSSLRALRASPADRAAHRRLARRLAVVGQAYEHLGRVAAERSATTAAVDDARDRVQAAMRGVRAAEEGLERHGYRIVFTGD